MTPTRLRHPNATRQSLLMGSLAFISGSLALLGVVNNLGVYRWLALLLAVPAAFFLYMCIRTATLRVRLDDDGIWEPNPFRLTYVTPWSDISQIRKHTSKGRVSFIAVQLVYKTGDEREIVALKMQAQAGGSEDTVSEWVDSIRSAKAQATKR